MTETDQLADKIASALAARLIPLDVALWDGAQVAAYLRVSVRQAKERITLLPTFPAPIRLPGAGRSAIARRWKAQDVIDWAERQRERRHAA